MTQYHKQTKQSLSLGNTCPSSPYYKKIKRKYLNLQIFFATQGIPNN